MWRLLQVFSVYDFHRPPKEKKTRSSQQHLSLTLDSKLKRERVNHGKEHIGSKN